jgi:hypothetical protein
VRVGQYSPDDLLLLRRGHVDLAGDQVLEPESVSVLVVEVEPSETRTAPGLDIQEEVRPGEQLPAGFRSGVSAASAWGSAGPSSEQLAPADAELVAGSLSPRRPSSCCRRGRPRRVRREDGRCCLRSMPTDRGRRGAIQCCDAGRSSSHVRATSPRCPDTCRENLVVIARDGTRVQPADPGTCNALAGPAED